MMKVFQDLEVDGSIEGTSFIKTGGTSSQFLKADGSVDSTTYAGAYVHPDYITTNINTSTSTIIDSITTNATGHITAMGTRVLTLGNLGYTGATNANNYVLPTNLAGDDFSIDTTALTGATVISDLDINITTDTSGRVTDANGTVATRTLTLANLGYTGATNANNYVLPFTDNSSNWDTAFGWGDHSTEGYIDSVSGNWAGTFDGQEGTYYLDYNNFTNTPSIPGAYVHPDYAATNINTSGATIVDIITTNSTGHVTALGTRTLTLANLGYTGATNANNITNNNQITNGENYITSAGNTQRTDEEIRDVAAAQWIAGTNTTVVKDDAANTIKINATGGSSLWTADTNGITYAGNIGVGIASDSGLDLYVGAGGARVAGQMRTDGLLSAVGGLSLDGNANLKDGSNSTGTSGQVLASKGTGTDWIDTVHTNTTEGGTGSVAIGNMVKITAAAHTALGAGADADTLYIIVG
tara:strand:- start:2 stop:1408 length:1407 start_codon:yes stop_codon:yes gene_type:complete